MQPSRPQETLFLLHFRQRLPLKVALKAPDSGHFGPFKPLSTNRQLTDKWFPRVAAAADQKPWRRFQAKMTNVCKVCFFSSHKH